MVVGHTKNAADRLFNALKREYRHKNIYVMEELIDVLSVSNSVTIHEAKETDFYDWEGYLSKFYTQIKGKIKENHIFSCASEDIAGNQIIVKLRKSDRDCDVPVHHLAIKRNFEGRALYPKLEDAIQNRPNVMKSTPLVHLVSPGINPYKKVEMNERYLQFVPEKFCNDQLYQPPTEKEKKIVKEEKDEKGVVRKNKRKKMMDQEILEKIEVKAIGKLEDKK